MSELKSTHRPSPAQILVPAILFSVGGYLLLGPYAGAIAGTGGAAIGALFNRSAG